LTAQPRDLGNDGYERFMFYPISKAIWLIVAPTNALILITAAATIWAVLRVSKWAAWLAVISACALVIGGFTPVGYWLTLPLENRFPQWEAGSQPSVDGIIVLGGEIGERITILAELTRDFPTARLVYSGPGDDRGAEALLNKFARLGGDRERVTMERRSRNTFDNAVYSRESIKPNAHERWLLVTAALHMPRAIGCFRRVGFMVEAYPIQYTTGHRSPLQAAFGLGSNALTRLDAAMKEWIGLVVYRLTDKTDQLFPAPVATDPSSARDKLTGVND
jgi:uncharacterized SAM-binding protein YcdF (DUF218 family)